MTQSPLVFHIDVNSAFLSWESVCRRAYIRAFGKMLEAIHASGVKTKWKTAGDVFSWWMEEDIIEGQISLFDLPEWQGKNET